MKTETTQKKSDDCSFFIVGNCTKEFHQTDRWKLIKDLANRLRPLQASDGSITELAYHNDASKIVEQITKELPYLVKRLPFQFEYFEALILDLKTWVDDNFPKPDFSKSLKKFTPERHRQDGVLYFSLFPMATAIRVPKLYCLSPQELYVTSLCQIKVARSLKYRLIALLVHRKARPRQEIFLGARRQVACHYPCPVPDCRAHHQFYSNVHRRQ